MNKIYLFIAIALLSAGCIIQSADQTEKTKPEPRVNDLTYLEIWKTGTPQHELVGYVEESTISFPGSRKPFTIYYVKDKFFKPLGFVTESGESYRYTDRGAYVKIGDFTLEMASRRLLNLTGIVYFKRLEPSVVLE